MELHITFRGLCLFVRSKNGKRVDVLFPETVHHARHEPDHVHHPRVQYNGLAGSGKQLRKLALRFDGLKEGNATLPAVLPNMLPAGRISKTTVPGHKLEDNPGHTVASRISLPAPDKLDPGQAVWFSRDENGKRECLELTHEVTLVYTGVDAGKLKPKIKELGNASNDTDLDEPQMSGGNVITVVVTHLPDDPNVSICPGEEVLHAHMYYEFLEAANDPLILEERPDVNDGTCGSWTPRCGTHVFSEEFLKRPDSGTAFNCMLAQAPPTT